MIYFLSASIIYTHNNQLQGDVNSSLILRMDLFVFACLKQPAEGRIKCFELNWRLELRLAYSGAFNLIMWLIIIIIIIMRADLGPWDVVESYWKTNKGSLS